MQALCASFMGLPQMINVLLEWLHTAGYRKREIQSMVEEHVKLLVLRHFDPKKADLIFTEEGSVCVCVCLYVLRHFDPKKADLIFTEEGSVCVCLYVLRHFDPKKADLIFTEEGSVCVCVCVCMS